MAVSHSEFSTMLQKAADLGKESLINFGREASENVIALTEAIKENAKGDYAQDAAAAAATFRELFASIVGPQGLKDQFEPVFQSALKDLIDNKGNLDPASNWGRIYEYFLDNNYHVLSRGITFDTSATEAGTGSGDVYRLTTNQYGETVEGCSVPLNIGFACEVDETAGADPGEESFSIAGLRRGLDILDQGSTVSFESPRLIQSNNSDGDFLGDASFQLDTAAVASPTDLGSWIDSAGTYTSTKYALLTDNYMSSVEEVANEAALSLEIKGNHTIYQELSGLSELTPYFWSIAVKPGASIGAGTLTVTWGSVSQAYDLTALSGGAGAWTVITPDLDKDLFAYNFANSTNRFQIAITSLSGDTVQIDNVRFGSMTPWGGTWWWIDAGTTQFLAGANQKTFNYGDVLAGSDSIIQRLVYFAYGLYLPAVSNATQITASGGRTLTFADSGGSDTITASSGSFVTDGYKAGMMVPVAGTSSNNGTHGPLVTVTATVLTFGSGTTLANEGPLSSTATLDATPSILDP